MPPMFPRRALVALAMFALASPALAAEKPKVPEGFEVKLVASVPAVEYPCQVATGPGGKLFVAEDPMDQVGPYESKNGRILLFTDEKNPVEFAGGFRAIQGMAWRDGELYVCHMPFLTVLKDTNGDGKADERRDLFKDLGPTNNQGLNDHIVSGIQFGIDGWLYISVGDKGIPKATGPDGRTIQIKGGGTARCRPDGTGIEVYTTGTRNHLEANLDDRDNLFTYDNTDDGLGWWTRVTHHIDGGYYGYAYDYHTRPDRFLNRMAEYGGGSPCGAIFYKEDAWPEKWRNVGYWAEWGKGKVQAIRFKPKGASFEVAEMIDFAVPVGDGNFRPIDLAISFDGRTMYIADWNMGGWGSKTEKVGRIWAIRPTEKIETKPRGNDSDSIDELIAALGHPAHAERMRAQRALAHRGPDAIGPVTRALADESRDPVQRRHLLWTLDALAGATPEATTPIMGLLTSKVPDLRAQAARALGERSAAIAIEPLEKLLNDPDPTVKLQALIALGRMGGASSLPAIIPFVADSDPYLAFSARVALRRIGDWKKAAEIAKKSSDPKVRVGVFSAMDEQYDPSSVAALIDYTLGPDHPVDERAKALQYLASVHCKAKPWDGSWWGTRPAAGEPPAKTIAWEATPSIVETVHRALTDRERLLRVAAIASVKDMKDRDALPILRDRFRNEPDVEARREVALVLGSLKDKDALPMLAASLKDAKTPDAIRAAALAAIEAAGTEDGARALVDLLNGNDVSVSLQPSVLAALGKFRVSSTLPAVAERFASPEPKVRAAAAEAAGKFRVATEAAPKLRPLANDPNAEVRKAAITSLGAMKDRESIPALLALADKEETRYEATVALAAMPDLRALQVYLRGLEDKNPDVRKEAATAVASLRDKAAPILEELAERHELPPATLPELAKVFTATQPIMSWKAVGPIPIDAKPPFSVEAPIDFATPLHGEGGRSLRWREIKAADAKGMVDVNRALRNPPDGKAVLAYAEIDSPKARKAQVVVGSDDTLTVWVNGKQVYDFQDSRGFSADQARFDVDLNEGKNRILVECGNRGGPWQFSVAVASAAEYKFLKAPSSAAFDAEAYRQFAMKTDGSVEKGKTLFNDPKGLACVKCHAVKGQGGAVGPDLSDLATKYPKDEIIQSVLYPSAKIFSGYEPVTVALSDGRVLTGLIKGETQDSIDLVDGEARLTKIPKTEIDEKKVSNVSLMPNGLAEGLSKQDFADLISYLGTLKDKK